MASDRTWAKLEKVANVVGIVWVLASVALLGYFVSLAARIVSTAAERRRRSDRPGGASLAHTVGTPVARSRVSRWRPSRRKVDFPATGE